MTSSFSISEDNLLLYYYGLGPRPSSYYGDGLPGDLIEVKLLALIPVIGFVVHELIHRALNQTLSQSDFRHKRIRIYQQQDTYLVYAFAQTILSAHSVMFAAFFLPHLVPYYVSYTLGSIIGLEYCLLLVRTAASRYYYVTKFND